MRDKIEWATLAIVLFILLFASFYVVRPVLDAIILSAFFAYVMCPVTSRIEQTVKSRSLAAIIVVFITVLPLVIIFIQLLSVYSNEFENLTKLAVTVPFLEHVDLKGLYTMLTTEIENRLSPEKVIQGVGMGMELFLKIFIIIAGAFYMLKERIAVKTFLISLAPRSKEEIIRNFLDSVDRMFYGVFVGHFITSLIVGIIAGTGYYVLGKYMGIAPLYNYPFLIGSFTAIATLLPIIGAWLIYIPISGFLLLIGDIAGAISTFVFGVSSLTLIPDFVIRPYISGTKGETHPYVILLGFISGPIAFGPIGIILGPAILGLFKAGLDTYRKFVLDEGRREKEEEEEVKEGMGSNEKTRDDLDEGGGDGDENGDEDGSEDVG
jgi:predicted PurR-regulated permease PerM